MFYLNTDRTMTQILLSLWSLSTRRVEALPKVPGRFGASFYVSKGGAK